MNACGDDKIDSIIKSLRQTKAFVLFLGAGINAKVAPLWNALLKALWEDAVKTGLSPSDQQYFSDEVLAWAYDSNIFWLFRLECGLEP